MRIYFETRNTSIHFRVVEISSKRADAIEADRFLCVKAQEWDISTHLDDCGKVAPVVLVVWKPVVEDGKAVAGRLLLRFVLGIARHRHLTFQTLVL